MQGAEETREKNYGAFNFTNAINSDQKDCSVIVDSQAQNATWDFPEIQGVVHSDLAKRKGYANTFHRWCTFIHSGELLASNTSQIIFSNISLSSDECGCGRGRSEHNNYKTMKSVKTEFHFWRSFGPFKVTPAINNPYQHGRPSSNTDAEHALRYPLDGPNEPVDKDEKEKPVNFSQLITDIDDKKETMVTSFPTEQAKAYRQKVKDMKQKGEKPKRKTIPILDPEHFDDCGEDLGELEALAHASEDLCWWETLGNLVNDDFLTTSEFRMISEPHWLNDDTKNPNAWHFLGFKAGLEHFETYNWSAHGTFHVDIMEIMGGEGKTTQVMVRGHFKAGKNFEAVMGIDVLDPEEEQEMFEHISKVKPLVIVMAPRCTAGGGWQSINAINHPETHQASLLVSQRLARICARAAQLQLRQNRHFLSELPKGNSLYKLPEWLEVAKQNITWVYMDMCMAGLKDSSGQPLRKSEEIWASHEVLVYRLRPLRCDGQHSHGECSGKESRPSQTWTWNFCTLVADGIAEFTWLMELDLRRHLLYFPSKSSSSSSAKPKGSSDEKTKDDLKKCPACRGHKVKTHPSHTRIPHECRFPLEAPVEYECPGCKACAPRLDLRHSDCRFGQEEIDHRAVAKRGPKHAEDPRIPGASSAGAQERATPRAADEVVDHSD